jgi:UDP-2,3-diacylglucosamine pyrophosphatase LpxH
LWFIIGPITLPSLANTVNLLVHVVKHPPDPSMSHFYWPETSIQARIKCVKFTLGMNAVSKQVYGYVVSDLHIFGCSSLYKHYLPDFYRAVSEHPVIVLNGDTFDFKRSCYRSAAETTTHALRWVDELIERWPNTTFYYLVGNHDCQRSLVDGILALSRTRGNISLHYSRVRVGTNLFLHGDALDLTTPSSSLDSIRHRYSTAEPSVASKIFAEIVTRLRFNAVEYVRHNTQSDVERIMRHLKSTCPEELDNIRTVYFGHTHVPFKDFEWEGITFNNTGSLIRGLRWMPQEFDLNPLP